MSVYFVTCRFANAVKIGFSVEPRKRVREIQWGCPMPVTLEAVIPGTMEDERAFHGRFADDNLTGEWFTITPIIEAIIAANPAPPPPAKVKFDRRNRPPKHDTLICRVRNQLRLSQQEMAQLLGISMTKLGLYERGLGRRFRTLPPELETKVRQLDQEPLV